MMSLVNWSWSVEDYMWNTRLSTWELNRISLRCLIAGKRTDLSPSGADKINKKEMGFKKGFRAVVQHETDSRQDPTRVRTLRAAKTESHSWKGCRSLFEKHIPRIFAFSVRLGIFISRRRRCRGGSWRYSAAKVRDSLRQGSWWRAHLW